MIEETPTLKVSESHDVASPHVPAQFDHALDDPDEASIALAIVRRGIVALKRRHPRDISVADLTSTTPHHFEDLSREGVGVGKGPLFS